MSIYRRSFSVGDYTSYSAASGTNATYILGEDIAAVVSSITNNYSDLKRLTFDSFVRGMGSAPYNYPSSQIKSMLNEAWPFLPSKIRDRLQKRETKTAPAPATPPVSAPQHPHGAFFDAEKKLSELSTGTKLAIGGGLAALAAFFFLRRR